VVRARGELTVGQLPEHDGHHAPLSTSGGAADVADGRHAPRADQRSREPSQGAFSPSSTRSLTSSTPGWQATCTRGFPHGHFDGWLCLLSPPDYAHCDKGYADLADSHELAAATLEALLQRVRERITSHASCDTQRSRGRS
jgi:hypothetical protein